MTQSGSLKFETSNQVKKKTQKLHVSKNFCTKSKSLSSCWRLQSNSDNSQELKLCQTSEGFSKSSWSTVSQKPVDFEFEQFLASDSLRGWIWCPPVPLKRGCWTTLFFIRRRIHQNIKQRQTSQNCGFILRDGIEDWRFLRI